MATEAILNAIKATLQAAELNGVNHRSIGVHAGKFTWAEIKARGFSAPAIFISCLGWGDADEEDQALLTGYSKAASLSLVIGIVTKHTKSTEARNALARALAERVTIELLDQNWAMDNVCLPKRVRAEGAFSAAAEAENCSLWLVTWQQAVGFYKDDWQASVNDFLSFTGTAVDDDENTLIETAGELDQE